ncbi:MAG: hypothetical protein JXA99_13510 [Candidatus Lokiarchaeota archaeon]|nr:hypothetical protein [Candidatus Lokiarchaeota archaeon]
MWELSDDDIKYFSCKICGEWPSYYACKYCHKRICKKCQVNSFCKDHYNKIPHENVIKLKNVEKKIKIAYISLTLYIFTLFLGFMYTSYLISLDSFTLGSILMGLSIMSLIIPILYCVICEKNKKKRIGEIIDILQKSDN